MLLSCKELNIGSYKIPAFGLNQGEMIKFWVELTPDLKEDENDFWDIEKMQLLLQNLNLNDDNIKLRLCPNQVNKDFFDFIKPLSAKAYLAKKTNLSANEINEKLAFFEIEEWYKIKNLGFGHQKVFSILYEFQQRELIVFHYYGLDPNGIKRLTEYIKTELKKGKSAIGFDNLQYKPNDLDLDNIVNLEIRRRN